MDGSQLYITIKLMFEELRRELLKFYYFWDFIKIYFLCGSLSSLNGFSFSKKVQLISNLDYEMLDQSVLGQDDL